MPPPIPKTSVRETLREGAALLGYAAPYRGRFGLGVACLLAGSAMTLCFPFLAGILIDAATHPGRPVSGWLGHFALSETIALLLGTVALQGTLQTLGALGLGGAGQRTVTDLRRRLYGRLINLPMTFFSEHRVGELSSRINADLAMVESALVEVLPQVIRQVTIIVGGLGLVLFTSVKLTGAMLLIVPLLVFLAEFFARNIRRRWRETQDRLAETGAIVDETFQAIATVKAYTNEAFEVGRYAGASGVVLQSALAANRWRSLFLGLLPMLSLGVTASVMWFGVRLLQNGELTVGDLTRFILYTTFIAGAMAQSADLFTRLQRAMGATARARELLREPEEVGALGATTDSANVARARARGEVRFEAVGFAYPGRPKAAVLRDVSLQAAPGEKIALVGPSGAGKSTLTALLLRFYDPQTGRIRIDGHDIREYPLTWLRQQIALVPQEVLLFGGSIEENIRYGKPTATSEEVRTAARLANADEFIAGFPEHYATLVGDRGVKLSGGQRQRIAIARAILKDPPILVLDEATSSLDSASEQRVQAALERLMIGRTTFIIAHRLATIRSADRIAVLHHGRIVEHGRHEELLQSHDGLYRRLNALQFQPAVPIEPQLAS